MEINRTEEQPQGLELRDYLRVLHTYWRGIVAIALVVTLLAFGWTFLQKPVYEAQSTGYVIANAGKDINTTLAADELARSKVKSYASVATSRPVAQAVSDELGLNLAPDELIERIEVETPLDTPELQITASAGDPAEARNLADAWVTALAAQVEEMETAGSDAKAAVRVEPLAEAALPTSPVSPNIQLTLAIGAVLGLMLGLAYALIRNHLDRRIRSAEMIEKQFGVPVIGTIPVDKRMQDHRQVVETGAIESSSDRTAHAMSEALRELRTNLNFVDVDNPPRVIVVTSSVPGEGKSSVTANLAVTIAASGKRVVVVDGDLRRPVVTGMFNLVPGAGVTDVLSGQAELEDVLQVWGQVPNLAVLGAGRVPPNPSELLGSKAMSDMLKQLAEHATVLIDAPPLLPVTDAAILSKISDGAMVVINAGKTTLDEIDKAFGNLVKVDAHILGAILNRVPTQGADAAQYGYYGQYYQQDEVEPVRRGSRRKQPRRTAAPEPAAEFQLESEDEFKALLSGEPMPARRTPPTRR
ncbi:lipopolysaccharide biosynthesis protein [Arthrobacter crystallopoietes BAB-32]|uniref:non-specific protein-tyrosine kinase n=1 Tax=Arthrobacter crystallopoietes BAB-32 TaxID=1246476 RepID=N1V0H1_9MICC|nr:polysaccharide biosynthesis tyrosine autokinase [Arthrobacter crystallopoietes]EMY33587.1 lipopolysaccharide biosynthesis protein [Arthrobacter crystallopoietes BAB-32]